MARTHPEGWQQLPAAGARGRERATLALLAAALPREWTIYHGLHWTRAEGAHLVFGEIAFAVVGPGGRAHWRRQFNKRSAMLRRLRAPRPARRPRIRKSWKH